MLRNCLVLACHPSYGTLFCDHGTAHRTLKKRRWNANNTLIIGHSQCCEELKQTTGVRFLSSRIAEKDSAFFKSSNEAQSYNLFLQIASSPEIENVLLAGKLPLAFHLITAKYLGQINIREVGTLGDPPTWDTLEAINSSFVDKGIFFFMWREIERIASIKLPAKHKTKKISVVIAHYNQGKFLEESVRSILDAMDLARNPGHELIVIDDGSTDPESLHVFQSLKTSYSKNMRHRISFFRKQNSGVGAARNYGAAKAKNDLLLFFDSDNVALKHMFVDLESAIGKITPSDIVTIPNIYINENGLPVHSSNEQTGFFPLGNVYELSWLYNYAGDSCLLIDRRAFIDVGGFDQRRSNTHQDWQLLTKAGMSKFEILVFPKRLYQYRIWGGSMSYNMSDAIGRKNNIENFLTGLPNLANRTDFVNLIYFLSKDIVDGKLLFDSGTTELNSLRNSLARKFPPGTLRRKVLLKLYRLFS